MLKLVSARGVMPHSYLTYSCCRTLGLRAVCLERFYVTFGEVRSTPPCLRARIEVFIIEVFISLRRLLIFDIDHLCYEEQAGRTQRADNREQQERMRRHSPRCWSHLVHPNRHTTFRRPPQLGRAEMETITA